MAVLEHHIVFVAAPLGWSYLKASLFNLRVLDWQAVIENMADAVFVFDSDDVLRSVNQPGLALIDAETPPEARPAAAVFAETPVLLDAYRNRQSDTAVSDTPDAASLSISDDETGDTVELVVDGEQRWYDIRVSPIHDSMSERTGTVLVARDVTVRIRQRAALTERTEQLEAKTTELERQNERLDQFASIVSHDLRNPLGIAQVYLDFAQDTGDADDFDAVANALDRMDEMIDDLLTMARAETAVEATELIRLGELAAEARDTVQSDGATFHNEFAADTTLSGDRSLLRNVFENLFHNSAEHNEPPVTVVVSPLADDSGFYIADDGPGIPDEIEDNIFEFGETTREDGTGFGLAIVRELVTAHDWTITVTDGQAGGARFEIRTDE
jgi:signal transduction histidine kinase